MDLLGLRVQTRGDRVHGLVDGPAGAVRERDERAVALSDDSELVPELDDGQLLLEVVRVEQDLSSRGVHFGQAAFRGGCTLGLTWFAAG